jgi:putative transposase
MSVQGPCHVLRLPLVVNGREAAILDQRLRVRGRLRNAALQTMLAHLEALRSDPRWQRARSLASRQKRDAYRELEREYGFSKREACNAAFAHWRASRWMPSVIDSRIALELGTEVWQQVAAYAQGRQGRPRFRPARESACVWGADNHAGLVLRGRRVVWRNRLTPRKNLSLELALSEREFSKRVTGREVVRVGIKRELVRGRVRFFALLCLAGEPYRDQQYLESVNDSVVVIDAGPSQLALVTETSSERLSLAPPELLEQRRREQQRLRRRQRALDRSRRATNPGCFDRRGRWREGKKATKRSQRYERLLCRQRADARRAAERRRVDETRLARTLVTEHGSRLATEAVAFRGWQRSRYGRRIGFTAPASALKRIARECIRVGGSVTRLEPALALSQHCLCGARAKKPLSTRTHQCDHCGLGPLDRDLFSAFLALKLLEEGIGDLSEGSLNRPGIRRKASKLCSLAAGEAPSPARFSGRQAAVGRLASKPSCQTPRQDSRHRIRNARAPRQAAATGPRFAGPS